MIPRIAVLTSIVADALVFYTVAEWAASPLPGGATHALPWPGFVLVALVAFVSGRFWGWFGLEGSAGQAVNLAVVFVMIAGLVRWHVVGDLAVWDFSWAGEILSRSNESGTGSGLAVTSILLLLGTWIRTSFRSANDIELESIARSMGVNFVVVTVVMVLASMTARSGEVGRAGAGFYAVAVLGLSTAQLGRSGVSIGRAQTSGVVAVLLGGTALIIVVALALFGLLFGILAPTLGPLLGTVIRLLLTAILTPVAWVLTHLMALFGGGNGSTPNLTQMAMDTADQAGSPDNGERAAWVDALAMVFRGFALVVMLGIAGVAVILVTRIRGGQSGKASATTTVGGAGSLGADLRGLFRSLPWKRDSRNPGFASSEAVRLYLNVLDDAHRRGTDRPDGATANEFEPTLESVFGTDASKDITRVFEEARYSGHAPSVAEVESLRQRWRDSQSAATPTRTPGT